MRGTEHYDSVACWGYQEMDIDIDIDGCDSNGNHVVTKLKEDAWVAPVWDKPKIDFQAWWNEAHVEYHRLQERGEGRKLCDVLGELMIKKLSYD